jgi:hypothetical protein
MSSRWLTLGALLLAMGLACCRGRDDASIARDPAPATRDASMPVAVDARADADDGSAANDADPASDVPLDGAIVLPTIDTTCTVDTDCATTFNAPSGPMICCWWCGTTAGNVAWVKKVEAICKAKMPGNCPGLDCPAGPMKAKCDKGKCVGTF